MEYVTRLNFTFTKIEPDFLITITSADPTDFFESDSSFPSTLSCHFQMLTLEKYTNRVTVFSYLATAVVMACSYVLQKHVKSLTTNHIQAQQMSLTSVSINLVWSFFYFSMLFQLTIQGEYLQYLSLPAFWYFICSFTFESRLFILVWRS